MPISTTPLRALSAQYITSILKHHVVYLLLAGLTVPGRPCWRRTSSGGSQLHPPGPILREAEPLNEVACHFKVSPTEKV